MVRLTESKLRKIIKEEYGYYVSPITSMDDLREAVVEILDKYDDMGYMVDDIVNSIVQSKLRFKDRFELYDFIEKIIEEEVGMPDEYYDEDEIELSEVPEGYGPQPPSINSKSEYPKKWFYDGKFHRLHGPAVINADGTEEYWLFGQQYNSQEELTNMAKKFPNIPAKFN